MKFNIDEITEIRKLANRKRDALFDGYNWEKKQAFTDGDITIIIESIYSVMSEKLDKLKI